MLATATVETAMECVAADFLPPLPFPTPFCLTSCLGDTVAFDGFDGFLVVLAVGVSFEEDSEGEALLLESSLLLSLLLSLELGEAEGDGEGEARLSIFR